MPQTFYKKAVVLGAAGFIGLNLARALAARGFTLVGFDRVGSPQWPSEFEFIIGDFNATSNELLDELNDALVFHLVSGSIPSASTSHVCEEISTDLLGTLRYLESTRARNLRWVFFSSGGTVYGQNDAHAIVETSPTRPICSYGIIKLTLERYFSLYRELYGLDHVIVRPSNPYGPWQSPFRRQGLIAALLHKAMKNEIIEIWGDGENVRDYIYIDDLAEGAIAAATTGHSGEIYNIGSGQGRSINQVVSCVSSELGFPLNVVYAPARTVDVRRNVLCSEKLTAHTGWRARITFNEGVARTTDWLRCTVITKRSESRETNK